MKQFDVHNSEQQILGTHFLEASAGTGKTYTIEHVTKRLVEEHHLKPQEILIVTFTKAATKELKERIAARLPLLREPSIFTLHGFCSHSLRKFPLEAGLGFTVSILEPYEERAAFLSFLEELPPSFFPTIWVSLLLKHVRGDLSLLLKRISKETPLFRSFSSFADHWCKAISSLPLLRDEFTAVYTHYKEIPSSWDEQLTLLEKLEKEPENREHILSLLLEEKTFLLDPIFEENRKKRSPPQIHPNLSLARDRLLPLFSLGKNPKELLAILSSAWRENLTTIRQKEEKITQDDLLFLMKKAIENPLFQQAIRSQYKAVIVDEFQDTDPIQWTILKTLFFHEEIQAFYLIGDPKQSIYSFRSADLYTYMEAKNHFGNNSLSFLAKNFRSSRGLGEKLSALFSKKPWLYLPKLGTHLEVPPLEYHKQEEGHLQWLVVTQAEENLSRKLEESLDQAYFLPFIVQEIQKLPYPKERMAILVKDHAQALAVSLFLRSCGLETSLQKEKPLGESLALQLIQELLSALFHPHLLPLVLISPLFALSPDDLTESKLWEMSALFKEWKEVLETQGALSLWRAIIPSLKEQLTHTLYHDLEEVFLFLGRERCKNTLLHRCSSLKEEGAKERPARTSQGVQIMTIHASKGLEFDAVFALGLAKRAISSTSPDEKELAEERLRQLYVACTRAVFNLYLPWIRGVQMPAVDEELSPIELFIQKNGEPSSVLILEKQEKPSPKVLLSPPTPSNVKLFYPLEILPTIPSAKEIVSSFSSLTKTATSKEFSTEKTEPTLPAGPETGVLIHKIFDRFFQEDSPLETIVQSTLEKTPLAHLHKEIYELIQKTISLKLPGIDIEIKNIPKKDQLHEIPFLYPMSTSWVQGVIDFCFVHGDKFSIIDWKTHHLPSYDEESLKRVIAHHQYNLQANLYKEALLRYLGNRYTFDSFFFIFVREPAIFVSSHEPR